MTITDLKLNLDEFEPWWSERRPYTTLADVTPERVEWLWPGRLPLGKIVILDGDPSTGKSTLALDFAARITTNTPFPDGARAGDGPAGAGVLLLSAEDGLADTIAPRLHAAGANQEHVHALTEVLSRRDDGTPVEVPPQLPRDIPIIRRIVEDRSVSLVVVDVLMAYLHGGVDSHRDQDVRGVLHQLATMAEQTGCTIMLIRHLNKTSGGNALYRGGGSIGIVGAARAGLLVARDPDDDERRILAPTKMNLGPEPPSLAYRLVSTDSGVARVEWEDEPVAHTAASLLRAPTDEDDRSESGEAAEWLVGYLEQCGGTESRKAILKAGKAEGFSEKVLRTARQKAGVTTERSGFATEGSAGSFWTLPDPARAHPTSLVPTPECGPERESVGTSGEPGHEPTDDTTTAIPQPCPSCNQRFDTPNPTCSAAQWHGPQDQEALL